MHYLGPAANGAAEESIKTIDSGPLSRADLARALLLDILDHYLTQSGTRIAILDQLAISCEVRWVSLQ